MILFSCCGIENTGSSHRPANILSEEQFARVLADYAMAESATNLNVLNVNLPAMDTIYAFDPLKFNNVRPLQYDSTLRYYSEHPELYKQAYDLALAELTAFQSKRAASTVDSAAK
jgi:hypothetical protein